MDDIREMVTHVLDQRGVLARMKAELRANVFLAIDDQEKLQNSACPGIHAKTPGGNRQLLKQTLEGRLLADLVREFLDWCGLHFTVKVYDPEMQCSAASADRHGLSAQLGIQGLTREQPVLLAVLQQFIAAAGAQQPALAAAAVASGQPSLAAAARTAPAAVAAVSAGSQGPHASAGHKAAVQQQASDDEDSDDLIGVDVHIEHEEASPHDEHLSTFARARALANDGEGADSDASSSASPVAPKHELGQQEEALQTKLQGTSPASTTNAAAMYSNGSIVQPLGNAPGATGAAISTTRSELSPSASPSSAAAQGIKPLGKLEPLAPLRGAKLGPLPALKLGAVAASTKDDPLLPRGSLSPAGRATLKSSEELKEELRMAGLICDAPASPTAAQTADAGSKPYGVADADGSQAVAMPGAKGMPPRSSALDTDSESDISTESFSDDDIELELPMGEQEMHRAEQPHEAGGQSSVFSDGETAPGKAPDAARANISLDFHESSWAASDRSGDFSHLHLTSGGTAGVYHADDESDSSSDDDF